MAQTAQGPRKKEFVGIPMDFNTKRRLKAAAKRMKQKHTKFARDAVVSRIEEVEKQPAAAGAR